MPCEKKGIRRRPLSIVALFGYLVLYSAICVFYDMEKPLGRSHYVSLERALTWRVRREMACFRQVREFPVCRWCNSQSWVFCVCVCGSGELQ